MIPIRTSEQKSLLAVCIVFTFLPTLSFGLRVWAQRIKKLPWTGSEYAMLAGLIGAYGVVITNLTAISAGGMGEHEKNVTGEENVIFLKSLLGTQLIWAASLGATKVSMCMFYVQIFAIRKFRVAAYFVMGASLVFALMVIMSTLLICHPLATSWDPTLPGGHCGNRNALWLSVGICNITTDILVLSLPIPMVWNLQVPRFNKLALSSIFGLGFFVSIISIIRLKFLLEVDFTGDLTWSVVEANIWSLLEPTMAVTIGCLPVLGPLFQKVFGNRNKNSVAQSKPNASHNTKDLKNFHELDDVLPLTKNQITATSTTSRMRDPQKNSTHTRDMESQSGDDNDGIRVITDWEVNRY